MILFKFPLELHSFQSFETHCIAILCALKRSRHRIYRIYIEQDAYHRGKHESRIRTSTALIAREINMRELKQNSQHFS